MQSILLRAPIPQKSNDASIAKFTHPPPYVPGSYAFHPPPATLPYLPSLAWFCLTKLALYPNQVNAIGAVRLNYHPPVSDESYDILRALIPSFSPPEFDWANVDPRLWATLVQIYDNLPPAFQCYSIPLADEHLRLLQSVQSTSQFSLITILELPGCRELLDTTIFNLKHLHSLCALDASSTSLSTYALKVLSETVSWSDDQTRKGPWGLRILRLRNCQNIDNISPYLASFQLLSILDLRGTKCRSENFLPTFHPAQPTEHSLYHPTPLRLSVALLSSLDGLLFSSENVFILHINTLHHPAPAERPTTKATRIEDVCVTLSAGSSEFFVGSSKEAAPQPRKRPGRFAQERKPAVEACNCAECVPGGLSLRRPHHMRDYALHNHIADQELSAHAAKQDAVSFYHSRHAPARARGPPRGYTYPDEAPMSPSTKDALLMLYRPPPPWAALEVVTPDVPLAKLSSLAGVVTALSNRKRAEMAEYSEQQLNEKRRRIQKTGGEAAQPETPAPETAPLARNPFRRKVSQTKPAPSLASRAMDTISSITPPPLPVGAQLTQRALGQPTTLPSLSNQKRSGVRGADPGIRDREPAATAKGKQISSGAFDWDGWGKKQVGN
ncbi:hypothetical protein B0H17DRAFT_1191056 [Mycena rosella]|uniref:Uncharacterized protein n=1 Tax=Mycena rosella TaxID=1033263 RepID=A0AAD7H1V7_MYCRO|nr:hypothetical protein B0H17DRAFT_1191056 [Mycena rosella]